MPLTETVEGEHSFLSPRGPNEKRSAHKLSVDKVRAETRSRSGVFHAPRMRRETRHALCLAFRSYRRGINSKIKIEFFDNAFTLNTSSYCL